jgi:hypothetical protein
MMLTAMNAGDQTLIDLTRFTIRDPAVRAMNGQRNARRNGYDLICRGCQRPVHLVLNHQGTMFLRHNPGEGRGCVLDEAARISAGQSPEHIAGKALLVGAIRDLTGWTAELEQRYDHTDGTVVVDVAATYSGPPQHDEQGLYAWEVQLASQSEGMFYDRTTTIERVSGRRARWITPHTAHAGATVAMICNPAATHIVDRVFESIEPEIKSDAVEIDRMIKAIHRRHPSHLWYQGGEFGEWHIAHRDALGGRVDDPTLRRRRYRGHYNTAADRADVLCTRPPLTAWSPPTVDYQDNGPNNCAICGKPVEHPWGFSGDPPQCKECFQSVQSRYLRRNPWP